MNHSLQESPLVESKLTRERMQLWNQAQRNGQTLDISVYGQPTEQQLKELDAVRALSQELQDNLKELETSVRIAEVENQAMNPTAPILDYSEDHEFMSAQQTEEENLTEAREEERRTLTKGKTEIQKFYSGECIFVTGGTGFLGKVMIEKLLRTCGDFDTLYVLIRGKKGKDPRGRLHELLDEFVFQRAHEANPKGIHKIVPLEGDMELPGLGLSVQDRGTITSRVSIIINAAATVKFDEKLSVAVGINVKGTKEVIKLAKECRQLKAVTHVSTAFANTDRDFIDEKFYAPPLSVEALEAVANIDEKVIEDILPSLLGKHPNTYCFTKCVAEEVVRQYGEGMPICIVRPSIVISTYEEPYKNWTDSVYGPTGLIIGIGTGVLRTMYMDRSRVADMVPVDLCVNAVLASAWHTHRNFRDNQTSNIPIYNFVSGASNPVTWGQFIDLNRKYGINNPTTKAVWYYGLNPTNNYYMFLFYNFFLHFIPALLIDIYFAVTGRRRSMLKIYNKVMKLANILFYFSTQDWKFSDAGVRSMWKSLSAADQDLFPFDITAMNWVTMCETFLIGLRTYLLKDDISTLPEARKKWNRLFLYHQILKLATLSLVLYIGYTLFCSLASLVLG